METALFEKNLAKKTITVTRHFRAPLDKVWKAWTNGSELAKWWAPKPWKAVTQSFDFKQGGHWHYYMLGPAGEKVWAWMHYQIIRPKEFFTVEDSFCDEKGVRDESMPHMRWHNEFVDEGSRTKIMITISFASDSDMQKIMEMGFEEGFAMGMNNLDEVLAG